MDTSEKIKGRHAHDEDHGEKVRTLTQGLLDVIDASRADDICVSCVAVALFELATCIVEHELECDPITWVEVGLEQMRERRGKPERTLQ